MLPKRRKSVRTKPEPDRVRCPSHLKWVRGFECCIAGHIPSINGSGGLYHGKPHECNGKIEAMHVRTGTDGAMGEKPGDNWTVPGCANAHRIQHALGEPAFERRYGIDMKKLAQELWQKSPARLKYEQKQREIADG